MRNKLLIWRTAVGYTLLAGAVVTAEAREVKLRNVGVAADVAVSVTDNSMAYPERESTIVTSLLLESDLRGAVEDAAWYFPDTLGRRQRLAMEALMMTQGWSRYDVPVSLGGNYQEPTAPIEKGATVCGDVKSLWLNKPIKNALINVIAPSMRVASLAEADENGRFCVEGLDVPDGTLMIFQALSNDGENESNLTLYSDSPPTISPLSSTRENNERHLGDGHIYGIGTILLPDIEVRSNRRGIYNGASASFSLTASDIANMKLASVEQAMRNIPGVAINGNAVSYRGDKVTTLINDGGTVYPLHPDENYTVVDTWVTPTPKPDWVISWNRRKHTSDGTAKYAPPTPPGGPTPKREKPRGNVLYSSLSIENVSRIDYYSPTAKSVFGINDLHSGGVIMVRLKPMGKRLRRYDEPYKEFIPLGYQRHKEFYTPRYELMQEYELNNRPTLYWIAKASVDSDGALALPLPPSVKSVTVTAEGIDAEGRPLRVISRQ